LRLRKAGLGQAKRVLGPQCYWVSMDNRRFDQDQFLVGNGFGHGLVLGGKQLEEEARGIHWFKGLGCQGVGW